MSRWLVMIARSFQWLDFSLIDWLGRKSVQAPSLIDSELIDFRESLINYNRIRRRREEGEVTKENTNDGRQPQTLTDDGEH
jgi:hypothetical protein